MPLYFEEYKLNEFLEIITALSRLNIAKSEANNLQIVREKLSVVLRALQFLITYSESPNPVSLNKLNCMVFNLIRSKFDMLNDPCIRNLNEKWNLMPKHVLGSKQKDALKQSTLNIEMLLNRLILPFTDWEILTSVEEELQQDKIGLFENGCADMRGLFDTFETRIADMWTCMKKNQFEKLCPIKLPLVYLSIEKHFDLCFKMHEIFESMEKGVFVDSIETIKEISLPASTVEMYAMYKDIESLDAVLRNLSLALSIDFDKEKTLGKWVLERTLQLIGEHVKCTIDSPKISQPMDKTLMKANVPLQEMKLIRNNLSHNKILTLSVRKELEEPSTSEYQDLMHDFKTIRSIFAKALSRKEFNLLLAFAINLEANYGTELADQNLVEYFFAIKNSKCLKDMVNALKEFSLKVQTLERMSVIVSHISEILNFLKFREVRRDVDELFLNVESTFRFCAQVNQSNASDTGSEDVFKPRMIKILSSKYSKYMKSMFTSMPTAISFKTFSDKFNDTLPNVPKSKMELYDSFITSARDKILPETHEKGAANGAGSMFDVDLRQLLMSCEYYTEDEIRILEMKWKLLRMIDSWKQRQDVKNDILLKLQQSQFDTTTHEHLIKKLGMDECKTRDLVELIDKDWKKAKQIIQEIPNYFEEFLDQLENKKDKMTLITLNQDELVVFQAIITSFLQTQDRNNQLENLANDTFRKALHALQEEISENELIQLKRKFDYSSHVHHVVSTLRIQISTHGFSITKDAYNHLLVDLQTQDKTSIEELFAGRQNSKRIQTALNRMTDTYGKFLKCFRENDQLIKNVKAFSVYARSLGIAEQQINLLISAYKRIEFLQFESFFYNRIAALEKILHDENDVSSNEPLIEKLYRRFKYNEIMKAAVEMVLLDLLNIFKYLSHSLHNYYQLEKIIAISNDTLLKNDQVTKIKSMRNALSHGLLNWHHLTQVFATALTFIQNGKVLLALHLVLTTEGGQTYLCTALDSNSWEHTLVANSLLEIDDLSTTIAQSNLWKDKDWRLRLKQILCNASENMTKSLDKSLLFKKFQEELFDAARRNDIPKLRYCIMRDANVNIRNSAMWTPLHYAATGESLDAISLLLKHQANVSCKEVRSWTPLHLAVMRNSLDSVKILIDNHATINCHTNSNLTPLQIANIVDASAIKKLLCKHGATDNNNEPTSAITSPKLTTTPRQDGDDDLINETQLRTAQLEISKEEIPVSKFTSDPVSSDDNLSENPTHGLVFTRDLLIADFATNSFARDVCASSRIGDEESFVTQDAVISPKSSRVHAFEETPSDKQKTLSLGQSSVVDGHSSNTNVERLMRAITSGALPIVKHLLNNVTDINARGNDGNTPLLKAASVGDANIVKLLLENGADVNSEDEDGATPLISASTLGYFSCVKELLINKADIDHKDNYGHSALNFALSGEFEDIVKILIENNACVNVENRSYGAPIHDAVFSRNSKMVQLLLDNGAFVNAELPGGETPLVGAFANHDFSTFKILLANGGDVNPVYEYGNPVLSCAIAGELDEIVDLVLEKGVEVNRSGVDGRTALMEAVLIGRCDLVERLLMAGAFIDVKDNKGNTAISEAKREHRHDIVNILMAKVETKAHENLKMKDCFDADGMSDTNHCYSGLGTELSVVSRSNADVTNVIVKQQAKQQRNFDLAVIAVREILWIAVRELCVQLISMVI